MIKNNIVLIQDAPAFVLKHLSSLSTLYRKLLLQNKLSNTIVKEIYLNIVEAYFHLLDVHFCHEIHVCTISIEKEHEMLNISRKGIRNNPKENAVMMGRIIDGGGKFVDYLISAKHINSKEQYAKISKKFKSERRMFERISEVLIQPTEIRQKPSEEKHFNKSSEFLKELLALKQQQIDNNNYYTKLSKLAKIELGKKIVAHVLKNYRSSFFS